MSKIEFSSTELASITSKLQSYFERELEQDLGQFDAEFLVDFISNEIGGYFYNKGLHDARAIFESRVESIDEDIYAIEKDIR